MVRECTATGRRCVVIALDVDGFKYVNDSRGHATGDVVPARVANIYRAQLRPLDFVGRLGGDEFAAALCDISPDDAQMVMLRLLEALRTEPIVLNEGRAVRVTASAGMAFLDLHDPQSAHDLLVEADVTMYQAKDNGRDRLALYSTFDPGQADLRARHTWVERIQDALEQGQLVLHAQPILNLHTNIVYRYEILLRMIGHDATLVIPGISCPRPSGRRSSARSTNG